MSVGVLRADDDDKTTTVKLTLGNQTTDVTAVVDAGFDGPKGRPARPELPPPASTLDRATAKL